MNPLTYLYQPIVLEELRYSVAIMLPTLSHYSFYYFLISNTFPFQSKTLQQCIEWLMRTFSPSLAVLACVIGSVIHLFLWVLLWLILTLKQHWRFKLRVTVGRATVRSARSIKLVTEVDLLSSTDYAQPLLVVGNGRTYTISDSSPKKAIMGVIQKVTIEKKARSSQGGLWVLER